MRLRTLGLIALLLLAGAGVTLKMLKMAEKRHEAACSQWTSLNEEVEDLRNEENYDQAVIVAKEALELAKRNPCPERSDGMIVVLNDWLDIGHSWDHPDVTESLAVLAECYEKQGKYNQAEVLYKRAIAIWEKKYWPDHPIVALSLAPLAEFYKRQGKYDQAQVLYERALAIMKKEFGTDNVGMIKILEDMAGCYVDQGKHDQAEPLYERVLAIREKVYGPDHPDAAETLENMSKLYRATDREQEAQALAQRAKQIRAKE